MNVSITHNGHKIFLTYTVLVFKLFNRRDRKNEALQKKGNLINCHNLLS